MSSYSNSSGSDLGEFCQPVSYFKQDDKNHPFNHGTDHGIRQPFVYFAQIPNGKWRPKNSKRNRCNYFEKAFKWYIKERHCGGQTGRAQEPSFATWLDEKYEEYLRTTNEYNSFNNRTRETADGDGVLAQHLDECTCQRKGRRSSRSCEFIMEPKDVTSHTASICYYQAATALPDTLISETTTIFKCDNKSQSAPQIADAVKSYGCAQVYGNTIVINKEKSTINKDQRSAKLTNAECQCPVEKQIDKQCQCTDCKHQDKPITPLSQCTKCVILPKQKISPPNTCDRCSHNTGPCLVNSIITVKKKIIKSPLSKRDAEVQTSDMVNDKIKLNVPNKADANGQTSDHSIILVQDLRNRKHPIFLKVIYADKPKQSENK